jgi:hypothetical protein
MARDLLDDLARECLARLPRTPVPRKSHVPPSDLERYLIVRNIGYATNLPRARSVALMYFNLLRRYGHGQPPYAELTQRSGLKDARRLGHL